MLLLSWRNSKSLISFLSFVTPRWAEGTLQEVKPDAQGMYLVIIFPPLNKSMYVCMYYYFVKLLLNVVFYQSLGIVKWT